MTCRNCKFYDRKAFEDKNGVVRFRRNLTARCLFNPSEIIAQLPTSVKTAYGFSVTARRSMEPDEGENCPQFTAHEG
jgi:hypothetical protein